MLLIEPPYTCQQWMKLDRTSAGFQEWLIRFTETYIDEVLSQADDWLRQVAQCLVGDLDADRDSDRDLHRIMLREVRERNFEPSGKVARLVVLCELGYALLDRDCLPGDTRELLELCEELLPEYLLLAIDDHFGVMSVPA